MTPRPLAPPVGMPGSDLLPAETAWMVLWRTVWLDLPLLWADAYEGFLLGLALPSAVDAEPLEDGPL